MAQNEMKAKPALPERVRSMEGLGGILWADWLWGKRLKLRKRVGNLVPRRLRTDKDVTQGAVYRIVVENPKRKAMDAGFLIKFGEKI